MCHMMLHSVQSGLPALPALELIIFLEARPQHINDNLMEQQSGKAGTIEKLTVLGQTIYGLDAFIL